MKFDFYKNKGFLSGLVVAILFGIMIFYSVNFLALFSVLFVLPFILFLRKIKTDYNNFLEDNQSEEQEIQRATSQIQRQVLSLNISETNQESTREKGYLPSWKPQET